MVKNGRIAGYLHKIWIQKFAYIYYLSAIIFAWLHELSFTNILLLQILTLPQLFSGLFMGYMRVNFGFQYTLLFHMGTNPLLIGLDIILK